MAQAAIMKFQGRIYAVQMPNDATLSQAALVFAREIARGTVSKLGPGGVLTSPETLAQYTGNPTANQEQTQGPDFSRQERGTAGVGRESDVAGIIALTRKILSYPLVNLNQDINQITFADYVVETPPTSSVANLTVDQVQSLMAAIALDVDQKFDTISQEKGVGRYGLDALQLELAGYLKPGTALKYFNQSFSFQNNTDNFVETMNSPNIWSGKNNVTSVDQILADSTVQAQIVQQLYQIYYNALSSLGTIQQAGVTAEPLVQGLILQNALQYGVGAATTWAIDRPLAALADNMQKTAQQALYALQLLDKKIVPNQELVTDPTAYVSTIADSTLVENAVREIINNPKIGTGPG